MATTDEIWDLSDSPVSSSEAAELDSFDPLEPPPLDWRSDSSTEEEDEGATENLTDFSNSPNTPTSFHGEATNNVQQDAGESVQTSPAPEHLDKVYDSNLVDDLDKHEAMNSNEQEVEARQECATDLEETALDILANPPPEKLSENDCTAILNETVNRNLDEQDSNQFDIGKFNQQDASASQKSALIMEEQRSSTVEEDQLIAQTFENSHAVNLDDNLDNADASSRRDLNIAPELEKRNENVKDFRQTSTSALNENLIIHSVEKDTSNFNQQDASSEHTAVLEEPRSLYCPDNQPTTHHVDSNDDDSNWNQESASAFQYSAVEEHSRSVEDTFQTDHGSLNLNQQMKYVDDKAEKTKIYQIMKTEFEDGEQTQPAVEDHSRHFGGRFPDFGLDNSHVDQHEPEFEERHPDRTDTDEGSPDFIEDEDHGRIHSLLSQLQLREEELADFPPRAPSPDADETTGLLFSEDHQQHVIGLLQGGGLSGAQAGQVDAVVSVSYSQEDTQRYWGRKAPLHAQRDNSFSSQPDDEELEPVWMKLGEEPPDHEAAAAVDVDADEQPSYKDVPGPCDPEDLLDGVIFGAKYLGSTQLRSDRTPSTNARMAQAQEAVDRIKAPDGETQPMTEVDLFISTKRIKVLTADTQEAMMDHPLQMISYIADIGKVVVLMARRKRKGADGEAQKKCLMICHVFISEDAQVIAQAIGQAFGVAYQQFLQVNGIKASELKPGEYSQYLESQELYNGDLAHFSDAHNLKEVAITKPPGEMLGLAVVESGWGSILPTVVVANMLHGGPAERCGELSIGDRIMSVNGTSLVGLPIHTCQNIIKDLKSQKYVKLSIVHCPPVTMAIIRRPDPKFQLGFSVEDGIICSLMRGGIAERGGIRVGHRIIEINGQSVVATTHEKIIQTLTNAVGEIHLKTMPASTYRLLTGQEQPLYL